MSDRRDWKLERDLRAKLSKSELAAAAARKAAADAEEALEARWAEPPGPSAPAKAELLDALSGRYPDPKPAAGDKAVLDALAPPSRYDPAGLGDIQAGRNVGRPSDFTGGLLTAMTGR